MAKHVILVAGLLYAGVVSAQSDALLADERGAASPDAVAVATVQDDFLLPTYTVADTSDISPQPIPNEVDILTEIFGSDAATLQSAPNTVAPTSGSKTFAPQPTENRRSGKNQAILTPLPPLPEVVPVEPIVQAKVPLIQPSPYADQVLNRLENTKNATNSGTMPREVRITFYKNQYSLNGQAMKWLKIFALKVLHDPRLVAEIRVSENNWSVQQRRLSLILQTLMEEGVSRHQLRVYKTGREDNTVILSANKGMAFEDEVVTKKTMRERKTITW